MSAGIPGGGVVEFISEEATEEERQAQLRDMAENGLELLVIKGPTS